MELSYRGKDFTFVDTKTAPSLAKEIFSDNYDVFSSGIKIRPGDVIIDLGANEGFFSILMAKMFPEAKVIAYEPVERTFKTLLENIRINKVSNVERCQYAVGAPGVDWIVLNVSNDFSGGSTSKCTYIKTDHYSAPVHVVSLNAVFDNHQFERCRLLKIDIEGMEYEALYPAGEVLPLVDFAVIEVHMNKKLEFEGRRADGLITWLGERTRLIHAEVCRMAE